MKKILLSFMSLAVALTLGLVGGATASQSGLECPDGQNIVVHMKRHINDLQGAQVAVRLATVLQTYDPDKSGNSSDDEAVNVTLFLTLQGPRLIDPAQPQDLLFGSAPGTLDQVVEGFLEAGGMIYACPLCAIEIGLEPGGELLYEDQYPGQVKIAAGAEDIRKIFLCADKVLDF